MNHCVDPPYYNKLLDRQNNNNNKNNKKTINKNNDTYLVLKHLNDSFSVFVSAEDTRRGSFSSGILLRVINLFIIH